MTQLPILSGPHLSDWHKAVLLTAWLSQQPDDPDPDPAEYLSQLDQIAQNQQQSDQLWQEHIAAKAWPESAPPVSGCCDPIN
jgi:hypothetical protein